MKLGQPSLDLTILYSAGIGLETVRQLALHGAKVYMGARSESRAKDAIDGILATHKSIAKDRLIWLPLDLSKLPNVLQAVQFVRSKESKLHMLGERYIPPTTARESSNQDIC
jgi:NAD(P)-dependent dehydrogenase (short-subunit alcohol dehydrogenase family)